MKQNKKAIGSKIANTLDSAINKLNSTSILCIKCTITDQCIVTKVETIQLDRNESANIQIDIFKLYV